MPRPAFTSLTRRDFLRRSGLLAIGSLAAASAWGEDDLAAGSGGGPLRVVFATDIHLMLNGGLGSAAGLAQCLRAIEALRPAPAFILCGGDLTQELPVLSLPAAEKHFDLFLKIWRDNTALPTRWMVGNHDIAGTKVATAPRDDPRFGEGLFRERLRLERTRYAFGAGGWRFIVLDDVSFNAVGDYAGVFDADQLAFLRAELAAHPDVPTAVCCHIPAISALPTLAGLARSFGAGIRSSASSLVVRNPQPFLDAVENPSSQVKLVLSGHLHHLEQTEAAGIRFINSGAVCGNWWRGPQAGCAEGFTVLDLHPDGRVESNYQSYGWKAVTS